MQGASYIYILAHIRKKYAEKFGYLKQCSQLCEQ